MSETAHTPGPWIVEKDEHKHLASIHYVVRTAEKLPEHPWSPRFICWMAGSLGESNPSRKPSDYRDDSQIEADARLIAAAPELLEALKTCVDGLRCQPGYVNSLVLYRAMAAVAKAEGK